MARFDIISQNGQYVRYSGKPKYCGQFGSPSFLEFEKISVPQTIAFGVGDYVDYSRTGLRYYLYSVPSPRKTSSHESAGDAFVYENVRFYCKTKDLEIAPFRDMVPGDNHIHFTTLQAFSVYDDVYGIAERIQACLDEFYGVNVWNIDVVTTNDAALNAKLHEEKEYSASDMSCIEALNEIYRLWSGIGWVFSVVNGVNTITIGRPNIQDSSNTTDVFSYGKGNGLKVVARAISSKSEQATRLYAYGSTRNLPPRYYNNLTPAIHDSEAVFIPNLMIPSSHWGVTSGAKDPRKAFLEDSAASAMLGLIPKTIYFDGTGDYEEMYPSIEGMTFEELRDGMTAAGVTEYVPSSLYGDASRVDEVKAVVNPTDNGIIDVNGEKYISIYEYTFEGGESSVSGIKGQRQLSSQFKIVQQTVSEVGNVKFNTDITLNARISSVESEHPLEGCEAFLIMRLGRNIIRKVSVPATIDTTPVGYDEVLLSLPKSISANISDTGVIVVSVSIAYGIKRDGAPLTASSETEISSGGGTIEIRTAIYDTFELTIKQVGFDISRQGSSLGGGLATIVMRDGYCAGRSFSVSQCEYDAEGDAWVLTCQRQKDESLGQYFPNTVYPVIAGDHYVITDMMMPNVYVTAAEQRLYGRALEVLAKMSKPKVIYIPEIDSKIMAESHETIVEGMYMPVYDEDLIDTETSLYPHTTWVLIDTVTINEGEDAIPIYAVTLKDEKGESLMQKITYEMNRNAKRIRLEEGVSGRTPYVGKEVDEVNDGPSVSISSTSDYFSYTEGSSVPVEGKIALTAIVNNIDEPSYQWYFLGESGWEEIEGETGQAYEVDPDSSLYYQGGEGAEDFLVEVTSGQLTYTAQKTIVKLKASADGALSVMLNNQSHIFSANETYLTPTQTDEVRVIAFSGTTRVAATVGTIVTPSSAAFRTAISGNGTTEPVITITAIGGASADARGTIQIPVTVEGQTITLIYSFALAFKGTRGTDGDDGTDGYNNAMIVLYKRSSSAPSAPSGTFTYNFTNDTLTGTLDGWSRTPQSGVEPLYMIQAQASSRSSTAIISSWSSPVKFVENGADGAIGKTMRGPTDWATGFHYDGFEGDGEFVDLVYYNGDYNTLWYCKQSHTSTSSNHPQEGSQIWGQTTIKDFVATKLFFAQLAYVNNLGVNVLKITKNGVVYGGFMPDNTIDPTSGNINGNYILWAGGATPQNAPFSVDKNGVLKATSGEFSGYLRTPFMDYRQCRYSAGYYYLDGNSNVICAGMYAETVYLYLPDSLADIGRVVNIYMRPRIVRGDGNIEVRSQRSGHIYLHTASSSDSYGLRRCTGIQLLSGGLIQLIAVPLDDDIYWQVAVIPATDTYMVIE